MLLAGDPTGERAKSLLHGVTGPVGRQVIPLGARTSINLFEQGLKRIATPAGIAGAAAGAALPEDVRESLPGLGLAIAAGGPVGLPVALGAAGRKAYEEGREGELGVEQFGKIADALAAAASRESIIPRSLVPTKAIASRLQPIFARETFPEQLEEIRELIRRRTQGAQGGSQAPLDFSQVDWSQIP